jgi:hypothetical protein
MTRTVLSKALLIGVVSAVAAFAQYKAEPAGAPPSDLPPSIASAIQKEGTKVTGPDGTVSEIWLVSKMPQGPNSGEQNVTLPTVPHGSFLGIIRFENKGSDRRGQAIEPGVYTLRYSMFPINGAHQGVAPQRDFFVLSKVESDKDPTTKPDFNTLMKMSEAASGTQHPLVMSIWKADDPKDDFYQYGENDWVLQRKAGDTELAIVVVGKAAA